jgi:hypothetical protein
MNLKEDEAMDLIGSCEDGNELSASIKCWKILE